MSSLHAASATDQGRVRPSNQDRVVVSPHLIAVADGMGGHNGGEVAASTAVESLVSHFGSKRSSEELLAAVESANAAVWEQSRERPDLRGMGTTLTAIALVVDGGVEQMTLINVGDSRAYLYAEEVLSLLTADHSLVEEMVRSGEITPDEAAVHPHRHILTRALGIESSVDVDAWRFEPIDGDRVLLCSDGLTNEVSEEEIAYILAEAGDPAAAAEELVRLAVDHGGNDNVTAIVVDVTNEHRPGLEAASEAATRTKSTAGTAKRKPRPPRTPAATAGHTHGVTGAVPVVPPAEPAPVVEETPVVEARENGRRRGRRAEAERALNGSGLLDSGPVTRAMDPEELSSTTAVPSLRSAGEPDSIAAPRWDEPPPDEAPSRRRRAGARRTSKGAPPGLAEGPGGRPVMLVANRGRPQGRRSRVGRIITTRVVLYAFVLVGTLAGIAGVVAWYVDNAYYVGLSGGQVVIYHGRPGGLLWFQPSIVERRYITAKQIIPPLIPPLRKGVQFSSLSDAEGFVTVLLRDQSLMPVFSTTTTVPSSTVPGVSGTTTTVSPVPVGSFTPTTSLPPTTAPPPTTPPPPTTAPTTTAATTTTAPKQTTTTVAPTTTTTKGKHHSK